MHPCIILVGYRDGYINIVQQAPHNAGFKRIVVMSSIVAFYTGGPFGVDAMFISFS
jgi:hypothetical protein